MGTGTCIGLAMDLSLVPSGVDFPFAMATSICLSTVTICSGLYLCIGICLVLLLEILSLSLVQKSPAGSNKQLILHFPDFVNHRTNFLVASPCRDP